MVVPETADDFRAAVSALRSLDVSKGVSFHTFSLPEDRQSVRSSPYKNSATTCRIFMKLHS